MKLKRLLAILVCTALFSSMGMSGFAQESTPPAELVNGQVVELSAAPAQELSAKDVEALHRLVAALQPEEDIVIAGEDRSWSSYSPRANSRTEAKPSLRR